MINEKPKNNIVLINENIYTIALDTTLDEDLIVEGLERELTRSIQVLRKEAGFRIEQRIELCIETTGRLMNKVIGKYINEISEETLAKTFSSVKEKDYDISKDIEFGDEKVTISLKGL